MLEKRKQPVDYGETNACVLCFGWIDGDAENGEKSFVVPYFFLIRSFFIRSSHFALLCRK